MVKRELNPARHLNDHKTISDSKRAFNKAFPYVIPALYRRFADELLVELHLLSHQKSFKPDVFFALGLSQAFNTFMRAYRPESHLEPLHEHLPDERENSNYGYTEIKDHDFSKEIPMLLDKGDVLIFHSFLMHKSYDNKSTERRTAMVYHFAETGTNFGDLDSPTNEWISVRGKGLLNE